MVPAEKILEAARRERADIIGLSGLITPSLDEMAHVARELERTGCKTPLLIGGATTSRAHTAVKLAQHYSEPIVHVLDASRAVPVATSLLSADKKPEFVGQLRADYARLREQHAGSRATLLPLEQARAHAPKLRFDDLPQPEFVGTRVLNPAPAPAEPAWPRRIGGKTVTEAEAAQLFTQATPPTFFSTNDTPALVADKRRLKERRFPVAETAEVVDRHLNLGAYASLLRGRANAYLVTPSTSGLNIIPEMIARRLQAEFGGEIVMEEISVRSFREAKDRLTYADKLGEPTVIRIRADLAPRLAGRNLVLVDDLLTSGETLNAFEEALWAAGIFQYGVCVLGAKQDARPVALAAARNVARELATRLPPAEVDPLAELEVAHPSAFDSLFQKAAESARSEPHHVYELLRRKAAALRAAPRKDARGEPHHGAAAVAPGTGLARGTGTVRGLAASAVAGTQPPGQHGLHGPMASGGDGKGLTPVSLPLDQLVPFIDWSPFFHTWELRGRYPAILNHERHGEEARKLFADAQKLLAEIVERKLIRARGVYGFFPANRVGDSVELYTDATRAQVLTRFHFLRQQMAKEDGSPNWCLADFVAPVGAPDFVGGFAVTTGLGLDELVRGYKAAHDDYNAIMAEALADRLAEAFAEYLHKRVRDEWGFGRAENLTGEQLINEEYRGIRPAAGYPACPDHTEKRTLWELLDVEARTGIQLTESCAMWPGSSVSGLYFGHPEAKYFAVGKLARDQVADLAARKGRPLAEMERWLGPWLNYDPQ
jgi:adenine/guanine phosphoribosyltransferase-like PRPP-binding protein